MRPTFEEDAMRVLTLAAVGAMALGLGGCGSDLKCGGNTHEQGGYCVVTDVIECGQGTHAEAGQCVPDAQNANCAPGTVQDPLDPSKCQPDCGVGTTPDPVTHKCVPTTTLIQPTVLEADENNDPLTGGAPTPFGLPAEGEEVIIGGVIGAPRPDADGYLVADYDGWSFTTAGPTLVEIEGLAVSHIRAAFMLAPLSEPSSIERVGFDPGADQARRQMWLDRAGDWVLIVSDANNVNDLLHPGLGGVDAPVGSDDAGFNYALAVRTLSTPAYSTLPDGQPMDGTYADGPKFFTVNAASGQAVEFWSYGATTDVVAATTLYETGSAVARSSYDAVTRYRAGAQPLRFVADYLWNWDSDQSATFEALLYTPADLGGLTAPVARTGEVIAATLASQYYRFTVDGTAVVMAAADPGGSPLNPFVTLFDATLAPLSQGAPDFALDVVAGTGAVEYLGSVHDAQYKGGSTYTYDLTVTALAATAVSEVEDNGTPATATPVPTLPAVVTATLADQDVDCYRVALPADGTLVLQTAPGAAGPVDTVLTLFAADGTTRIADNDDIDLASGNYLSRIVAAGLTAGDYVVAVAGYTPGDYQLVILAQ
jgi:hypothetical protein